MAYKRITLYFTLGSTLTEADIETINNIPGGAHHRNASYIGPEDKCEKCDFVAGPAIPQQYIDAGVPVVGDIDGDGDADEADLKAMTVPQLKALAAERGVDVPDGSKKADIIALLS